MHDYNNNTTMGGKRTAMNEGSVADRGGKYDKPSYTKTKMPKGKKKKKMMASHGFGNSHPGDKKY